MAAEAFGEQWRRRQEIDKPVKGCPKAVLRKDAFGRFQCSKFCGMGSFQSKLAAQAATDATLRLKSRKAVEKDTRRGLNIENEAIKLFSPFLYARRNFNVSGWNSVISSKFHWPGSG